MTTSHLVVAVVFVAIETHVFPDVAGSVAEVSHGQWRSQSLLLYTHHPSRLQICADMTKLVEVGSCRARGCRTQIILGWNSGTRQLRAWKYGRPHAKHEPPMDVVNDTTAAQSRRAIYANHRVFKFRCHVCGVKCCCSASSKEGWLYLRQRFWDVDSAVSQHRLDLKSGRRPCRAVEIASLPRPQSSRDRAATVVRLWVACGSRDVELGRRVSYSMCCVPLL